MLSRKLNLTPEVGSDLNFTVIFPHLPNRSSTSSSFFRLKWIMVSLKL